MPSSSIYFSHCSALGNTCAVSYTFLKCSKLSLRLSISLGKCVFLSASVNMSPRLNSHSTVAYSLRSVIKSIYSLNCRINPIRTSSITFWMRSYCSSVIRCTGCSPSLRWPFWWMLNSNFWLCISPCSALLVNWRARPSSLVMGDPSVRVMDEFSSR